MKNTIHLYTKNCIITGKPASCWSGHVKAVWLGQELQIIAGFVDHETSEKVTNGPCFGDWKIEHGLKVVFFDDELQSTAHIETGEILSHLGEVS